MLVMLSLPAVAQDFSFNFLGQDFSKYRFSLLKVRDDHAGLEYMFYDSLKHCQALVSNRVSFPVKDKRYSSNVDSLRGKVFRVERILGRDGREPMVSGLLDHPIFVLKDMTTNDTLYFKYDPHFSYKFPFEVSGVANEEDEHCHCIEKKELGFLGVTYLHTPSRGSVEQNPASVHKTVQDGKAAYSLNLRGYGTRPHSRVRGVTIIFKDGSRIIRNNAEVTAQTTEKGYEYSASIKLTPDELEKLRTVPIAKHRLYIYDTDLGTDYANKLKLLSRCISKLM